MPHVMYENWEQQMRHKQISLYVWWFDEHVSGMAKSHEQSNNAIDTQWLYQHFKSGVRLTGRLAKPR